MSARVKTRLILACWTKGVMDRKKDVTIEILGYQPSSDN